MKRKLPIVLFAFSLFSSGIVTYLIATQLWPVSNTDIAKQEARQIKQTESELGMAARSHTATPDGAATATHTPIGVNSHATTSTHTNSIANTIAPTNVNTPTPINTASGTIKSGEIHNVTTAHGNATQAGQAQIAERNTDFSSSLNNNTFNNALSALNGTVTEKAKSQNEWVILKPALVKDAPHESATLMPLKEEIASYIEAKKQSANVVSVAVYVRSLNNTDWLTYNDGKTFHPASLNKVATLMSYMRAAESDPGLLNQKIKVNGKAPATDTAHSLYTLQGGKTYTVRELLHYMIAYSDNEATGLLLKALKPENYYRTYTELGLEKPKGVSGSNELSAKEFSVFMKALYFGSYLSQSSSEFCNSLLTECDYKDGLLKGIPAKVPVAHKFGEFGDGQSYELHESGIVYIKNNPYIITVMTKGYDRKQLSEVISKVSGMVYRNFSATNK
jgi:beta-lactamase class A